MPTLYLWQTNDITSVGPDVFSNTGDANGGAVGVSTFSIDSGATTHAIDVVDDDGFLENNDGSSQDISTAVSFDGASFSPGDNIQVEYSYIVRPVGSSDPADNITVYGIRMDNTVHGVASDAPLIPGVSYDVLSISSNSPSVSYSSFAVCYAPGTLIDTPDGPRTVETLKPGDLVLTLDHGPQAIRWIRSSDQTLEDAEVDVKPVQIKAGALGPGLPARDLIVSPQHRILVGARGQLSSFFDTEAFAPARSLISLPGIRQMKGKARISWIHFACDRHEVVTANGCLSESLLLGPMVLNCISAAEHRALAELFGPAVTRGTALNGPPARNCLKMGTAERQITNHCIEKQALLAKKAQHSLGSTRQKEGVVSATPSLLMSRIA